MAGQPKPAFYFAVVAGILGLVGVAVSRADICAPKGNQGEQGGGQGGKAKPGDEIDPKQLGGGNSAEGAEAADTTSITTVKEYSFKPSERLPDVKGTAAYTPMEDKTVRF